MFTPMLGCRSGVMIGRSSSRSTRTPGAVVCAPAAAAPQAIATAAAVARVRIFVTWSALPHLRGRNARPGLPGRR